MPFLGINSFSGTMTYALLIMNCRIYEMFIRKVKCESKMKCNLNIINNNVETELSMKLQSDLVCECT